MCSPRIALALALLALPALAQRPAPRILVPADNSARSALAGSKPPMAIAANDAGLMPQSTKIQGISINFSRSAAQQATLDTLLAAQQDPTSAQYHQWLSPDQFAAQFGMADADLTAVQNWLTAQGFTVDSVSRGLNRIAFTGTEAQVEAAFQTQIHYFTVGTEKHFAPASDLTIPTAFAGVIQSVGNLSDLRPRSHLRPGPVAAFNSGQTSSHFLTPKDVATIYDVNAAYTRGFTGAGQSIAIMGQTAVILSDIANFKAAAGVTAPAPIPVLYPGTGTSTVYTGDEAESDLDLEYSGSMAPGATVYFVYTGSSTNYGVFNSLEYAIQNDIAPILSISYGECETSLGATNYAGFSSYLQQAAAQGQTIIASSGDSGSTDCYGDATANTAQQVLLQTTLAVDFPGDSPYVTALGGSEFPAADVTTTSTNYWGANSTTDLISSALSYIPEQAWNDDSTSGISSGGGGQSIFGPRPTWQNSSVPGISSITANGYVPSGITGAINAPGRLVPDIALSSSPANAGYLYCSSDTGTTGVEGSCSNGFRNAASTTLTVAGGTSFAAPIFAGMLALINQGTHSTGQGQINPTLYSLASNSITYASAFHDITAGTNACTAAPVALSCTSTATGGGASGFSATTGYDQATGLGSIDLNKLLTAWPVASAKLASTTTLTAATPVPKIATTDNITIAVTSGSSSSSITPTGTVSILINGVNSGTTYTLVNGAVTLPFTQAIASTYLIVATYSGDVNYAPSTATILLQVGSTGGFTLTAPTTTITDGSTGTASIAVTPVNGYTGTVNFTVNTSPAITNACYTVTSAPVTGTLAAAGTLTIYTNETSCTTATTTLLQNGGKRLFRSAGGVAANQAPSPQPRRSSLPLSLSFAGLLTLGVLGRRSRVLRGVVAVLLLAVATFGLSACSGASSPAGTTTTTTPTTYATKGSYTIIVQGTDSVTTSTTNYASFTLTIQ